MEHQHKDKTVREVQTECFQHNCTADLVKAVNRLPPSGQYIVQAYRNYHVGAAKTLLGHGFKLNLPSWSLAWTFDGLGQPLLGRSPGWGENANL